MILDERTGAGWRLIRGDSLLVLRDLPAESVDAVIADPPYSSGGQFRGDRAGLSTTKYVSTGSGSRELPEVEGDSRDQRSYLLWSSLWLAECLRIAKPGSFVGVFTDWRQAATTTDAIQCGGFVFRGVAPWCKPASRPQSGRLRNGAEFVVWGSKGPLPIDRDAEFGPGYWVEAAPGREREHITEKPMGVMRDLAKQCIRGGVVLDPFGGASTTGCAALLEGRRFIGIETSPAYFEIACRRLAETEAMAERGSLKSGQGALFGGAS